MLTCLRRPGLSVAVATVLSSCVSSSVELPVTLIIDDVQESYLPQRHSKQHVQLQASAGQLRFQDGRPAPRGVVEALARAISSPQTSLQPDALWPGAQALRAAASVVADGHVWSPAEKQDFADRLSSHAIWSGLVREQYYETSWTEDYPSVRVELVLPGGRQLIATTRSQQPYMLPWSVEGDGVAFGPGGVETWDPGLPRAVAALLPEGSPNRRRLLGASLAQRVAETADRCQRAGASRPRVLGPLAPSPCQFLLPEWR